MKKIFLFLLLTLSMTASAQMKMSTGSYDSIPYVLYDGPGNDLVVIAQGSGEFTNSYTTPNLTSANSASTYASHASRGKVYPFDILVAQAYKSPYARSGDNPTHLYLMRNLSELVRSLKRDAVILTGYSYGGQLTAGFMIWAVYGNGETYIDPDVFDGFVIIAGKAPGSQNWQVFKDKPRLVVHGINDTAVPISNGTNIVNKSNAAGGKYKVYANRHYDYKLTKWVADVIPDSAFSRYYVLVPELKKDAQGNTTTIQVAAGHGDSWRRAYDVNDEIGFAVLNFIKRVRDEKKAKPLLIYCKALLDTINLSATFILPDSTQMSYRLTK
jgi:predicted esterase